MAQAARHTLEMLVRLRVPTFRALRTISRESARQRNIPNQFVSRQSRLLIAGESFDNPLAVRRERNQRQFSVIDKQRGQGIGCRRSVRDVASERSAILICNSSGP